MAIIAVSDADVQFADVFLTAYLQDHITDADFSEGSVVRDFVVKAIAFIFAYFEKERKITRDRQSLLSLATLSDGESIDDAVDALLSNWFLTRRDGVPSTITAVLHFSQAIDVTLPVTVRFFRSKSQAFVLASTETLVIPASELRPNINANGSIADYSAFVTLKALQTGIAGNLSPGRFLGADPFNSFFLFAENATTGDGGADIETTTELLERAPTAISVRNLINRRSIDTVLRDTFTLDAIRVIGMEEPEMMRDFSTESVSGLHMHVGGFEDIYIQQARVEVLETLVVGGAFARPDNLINMFRDTVFPGGFILAGVVPGDILRINAGLANTPREFLIITVAANTLEVQPRAAFSAATDETGDFVDYTIGNLSPSFDNLVGTGSPLTTGQTSRKITTSGRVTLLGRPQYKITSVEVVLTPLTVDILGSRVNGTPGIGEYQVITRIPANAQSAFAVTDVVVDPSYDGKTVRIRYETLVDYISVQNHVRDLFERVVTCNPLVKAFNPVYLSLALQFKLKAGAAATVLPSDVSDSVAAYINAFSPLETLELSGIVQNVRDNFPDIGAILSPLVLVYSLLAPDGQVYEYETEDLVELVPENSSNAARLTNGADLRDPLPDASIYPPDTVSQVLIDAANIELGYQLDNLGISDRTVVYYALAADIVVTQVL